MNRKTTACATLLYLILFLNFFSNFWHITNTRFYTKLDECSEGMAYGRLLRSKTDGIFSQGGFLGVNYTKDESNSHLDPDNDMEDRFEILFPHSYLQKSIYLKEKPVPEEYLKYRTHPGGQMIIYSFMDKILPFTPKVNLVFFKLLNASFTTSVFFIFLLWINKKFGKIPALTAFVFVLFSPWLARYADSLFWTCSGLFIPFVGMVVILEKKTAELKSLLLIFLCFLIKCLFTGFEFISCVYFSVFIPIIFFYYLEKQSFKNFFFFSVKTGIACGLAIVLTCGILILQHYMAYGSFEAGLEYIIDSYQRRSAYDKSLVVFGKEMNPGLFAVATYLIKGNCANFSFLSYDFQIPFIYIIGIIYLSLIGIYLFTVKLPDNRIYKALILSVSLSIIPPLSWYIIFKEHALTHVFLDYICWYIPLMLMGFVSIGVFLSLTFNYYRDKRSLN